MPLSRFITKTVPFNFRGKSLTFDLSQGLFSSAGIDTGTKLLLKVFSQILDEDATSGKNPPRLILDSGCGCGIIGICAATVIPDSQVRCQDRDELARLFTLHNAEKNGIPPSALEAYTEPLLAVPESGTGAPARWDMILTNIPAKAGEPVLEDFVRRSGGLLNPGGKVIIVAVHPLADFFRARISGEAELLREKNGSGHSVFVYGKKAGLAESRQPETPVKSGVNFITQYPFYARTSATCDMENIPVKLETIHGASGFDSPGGAILAAAKLIASRQIPITGDGALLIHEPEQGFFPCWLLEFLKEKNSLPQKVVLSGRNILSLETSSYNVYRNEHYVRYNTQCIETDTAPQTVHIVPAADLPMGHTTLLEASGGRQYGCIAAFPELLPQSLLPRGVDQLADLWDSLPPLLAKGGIVIAAFRSSDGERFDRKKPGCFNRLGSIKKGGFRALAYNLI